MYIHTSGVQLDEFTDSTYNKINIEIIEAYKEIAKNKDIICVIGDSAGGDYFVDILCLYLHHVLTYPLQIVYFYILMYYL
jgi:acetyl esterase/lipase